MFRYSVFAIEQHALKRGLYDRMIAFRSLFYGAVWGKKDICWFWGLVVVECGLVFEGYFNRERLQVIYGGENCNPDGLHVI